MKPVTRSRLLAYAVAVAATMVALLLTLLLGALLDRAVFILFFAAVIVSAWYGSLGPGLLATALSALATMYFSLPARSTHAVASWDALLLLGLFVGVAALISVLQAQRHRAEEWSRVTLTSIGDAVIVTDRHGRVVLMNPEAERLTGWPREQAQGQLIDAIFPINEQTRQTVESPVARVLREGAVVGLADHTVLITRDGTERPIRDITQRREAEAALQRAHAALEQRVQERTAELARANDTLRAEIAQRRQAEAAVREREARYRQMFERNRAVKLLIDPKDGTIVDANPAAAEFYGYPLDTLRRLRITDINTLPPAQVTAEMARALSEQPPSFLFRHRLASGEIRDVEVHSSPLEVGGRRLLYSIVHDITKRRQAEQSLQRAYDELERKVAERTAELEALNAQLQTSLREQEILLKEVHHRVKNNLQIISSLLSLQVDAIEEPRLLALFTDCQHRIQSMALVHDILYRADHLDRVDLAHYVERLVTELAQAYAVDPERIRLTTQLETIWVSLDTVIPCGLLLHELLSNCFKHAFPASQTGEVSVMLRTTPKRGLVLQVQDNGCGFPEGLDFHHTESLGLQLVCLLTEQLQGTIACEHIGGEHIGGTRFTITFPAYHISQ